MEAAGAAEDDPKDTANNSVAVISQREVPVKSPRTSVDSSLVFTKRGSGAKISPVVDQSLHSPRCRSPRPDNPHNVAPLHWSRKLASGKESVLPEEVDMLYDGFIFTVRSKQNSPKFDERKKRKDLSRSFSEESPRMDAFPTGNLPHSKLSPSTEFQQCAADVENIA